MFSERLQSDEIRQTPFIDYFQRITQALSAIDSKTTCFQINIPTQVEEKKENKTESEFERNFRQLSEFAESVNTRIKL